MTAIKIKGAAGFSGGVSVGVATSGGKKSGMLVVTSDLIAKLEAAGEPITCLPPEGSLLVGVETGAEFSFTFLVPGNGGAIVPSIRGVNPITGLRASQEDQASYAAELCGHLQTDGISWRKPCGV